MLKKSDTERRDRRIASYVTKAEEECVRALGSMSASYASSSDVVRKALALLIEIKHPELKESLTKTIV